MALLPPFLVGGVIGVLLKRGYDQLQPRMVKAPASGVTVVSTPLRPVAKTQSSVTATPVVAEAVVLDTPVATASAPPADEVTAMDSPIPPVAVDPLPLLEPTAAVEEALEASAPSTTATEVVTAPVAQDDLAEINGIGPVYASRLQEAGIHTFAELAQLTPERIQEIIGSVRSGHMIDAESWIAEARLFAAGGKA